MKVVEQYRPEHLFIEPSGIASPSGVINVLDTLKISPVIILVNKIDLADKWQIDRTVQIIEGLTPNVLIFRCVNAEISRGILEMFPEIIPIIITISILRQ